MKPNPVIGVVRWDRIPAVAESPEARAWLNFQACRGLVPNTLDAYGRNLERYLRFLKASGRTPPEVKQEVIGAYLRELAAARAGGEAEEITGLANATIQQHLATLRLFYDHLVEDELSGGIRSGEGLALPREG